jgi:hypothetical protein
MRRQERGGVAGRQERTAEGGRERLGKVERQRGVA